MEKAPDKELAKLIVRHQQAIYGYIYTLLPNRTVAEDILQETFVTVVEKFNEFEAGTNFLAWVRMIAYWKVRQAKASYARSKIVFSDSLLEVLKEEFVEVAEMMEMRHEALDRCLSKLKDRDRKLLMDKYCRGLDIAGTVRDSGRSVHAAYKALMRIRRKLQICVERELTNEGAFE